MKKFDPQRRVELENGSASPLAAQVLNEIRAIETRAREAAAQGKNARMELAGEIDDLKGRVSLAHFNAMDAITGELATVRRKWEMQRDKNATAELARLERAKLKIGAMDDTALRAHFNAVLYHNEPATHEETQLMLARLTDPVERETLAGFIQENRIDKPWLETEADHKLMDDYQRHEAAPAGSIKDEFGYVDVEQLIDFDDELNTEL